MVLGIGAGVLGAEAAPALPYLNQFQEGGLAVLALIGAVAGQRKGIRLIRAGTAERAEADMLNHGVQMLHNKE